jgi:hypothetical protein
MHEMHQLPLRSLPGDFCCQMSGIRHIPRGVQHRLANVSVELRKRNYRVGMALVPDWNRVFPFERADVRKNIPSFYVEHRAN